MRLFTRALGLSLLLALCIAGSARGDINFTIGSGDFYVSVGDYDYLPSFAGDRLPQIRFYDMMSQYGSWGTVSPFGRVWRPYVYSDWQPFSYGHWVSTQYGMTWIGYEPWAWAAYHYGNWIRTQQYGWVWIPGYNWHPGRVIWSYSYGTIGWMPAPPPGYNYLCGYLCSDRSARSSFGHNYQGDAYTRWNMSDDSFNLEDYNFSDDYSDYNQNGRPDQFPQNDPTRYGGYHGQNYGNSDYGNRYDPYTDYNFYYNPYLYNSAYLRIAPRLWVFVPTQYFGVDDYSLVYFEPEYVNYLFGRRLVQISRSDIDRYAIERITGQRLSDQPVRVRQMQADNHNLKVVTPEIEKQEVQVHANEVVKQLIAPAFVQNKKVFRGKPSGDARVRTREVNPDSTPQQPETKSSQTVLREADEAIQARKAKRQQIVQQGMQGIKKAEQEGSLRRLDQVRERAERNQPGSKNPSAQQPADQPNQKQQEDVIRKRNVEPSTKDQKYQMDPSDNAKPAGQNFDQWLQAETTKFQAWKDHQAQQFETWKKRHEDQPDVIKKAEADFQQKMKEAEQKFEARKQRMQQSGK